MLAVWGLLYTYVALLFCIPIEKRVAELLFLTDVNIPDWNLLSVYGMIFRIFTAKILYTKQNQKESSKLYFRTAIQIYSLALTWKAGNEGGSFVR